MLSWRIAIRLFVFFFALLYFSADLYAQLAPVPHQPHGYVNDYSGVINDADEQVITAWTQELDKKTTAQVAVVTVRTTKPEAIAQYSMRIFDEWKIGQKGKDNGALLVVAIDDREAWITTGYGVEGILPDVLCSKIVRDIMVPYFKEGRYSEGIREGTKAIVSFIAKDAQIQITGEENEIESIVNSSDSIPVAVGIILWILIVVVVLFLIFSSRRNGYWYGGSGDWGSSSGSSGSFGGGFGGFGGGMSGGGGGGGRW